MRLSSIRGKRAGILAALTVGTLLTLGASGAQAAVTSSSITTPADGSLLFQNQDTNPAQTFTVSGTSNGSPGDLIEIDCYQGTEQVDSYSGTSGIAVGTNGNFSVLVPESRFGGASCHLVAIAYQSDPTSLAGYTGPRVGFSYFATTRQSGGPNSGDTYDYTLADSTPTVEVGNGSIDDCGPYVNLMDGTSAMNAGPPLLDCAGSFYNSSGAFSSVGGPDLTRAEIQIDGQNAYGSDSADLLYPNNPGFPSMTATLNSFDTSNGNAQVTDAEPLVRCAPDDVYNPSSSDCSSFAGSGVSVSRVNDYTDAGHVQTVSDTYTSTDGSAHTLSLLYETDLDSPNSGWELPGQTTFTHQTTGVTGPAPSRAPATVYTIYDTGQAPSLANPVAAMTFASPYSSVRFDNTLWSNYGPGEDSALFDYERTVKPNAPVTITWSYATESSLSQVQGDGAAARAALAAPRIKFTSPRKGAVVGSRHVTVKGTASAKSGLASVTVNGVSASLSGDHWKARIVLKKGRNTITALATSKLGSSSHSSEKVTYGPVVSIATSRAHYSAARTRIKLVCSGPSGSKCRGTLTLTKGAKRLGRSSYAIKAGHHRLVTVSLPTSLTGTVHARAKATVKHGGSGKRRITLVA